MGEFEIESGKAAKLADQMTRYSSELRRQKERVDGIAGQLVFGGNYQGIQRALSMIGGNLYTQQMQMKQYAGVLEHIIKTYQRTEAEIAAAAAGKG